MSYCEAVLKGLRNRNDTAVRRDKPGSTLLLHDLVDIYSIHFAETSSPLQSSYIQNTIEKFSNISPRIIRNRSWPPSCLQDARCMLRLLRIIVSRTQLQRLIHAAWFIFRAIAWGIG